MKKKLTREQRQLRYIPFLISCFLLFIYIILYTENYREFFQRSLFDNEDYVMSRFIDIPFLYLATLLFTMFAQKDRGESLVGNLVVNVIIMGIAALLALITNLDSFSVIILALSLGWGLIYNRFNDIWINLLMLCFALTMYMGIIYAFTISFFSLIMVSVVFYMRLLAKKAEFRKFIFKIGLAPDSEYQTIENEDSDAGLADLSQKPREFLGFKVYRHNLGPKNFFLNPGSYNLFLSNVQKSGGIARWMTLFNFPIIQQTAFNANLLDWLLENQDQIPEEFKDFFVVFGGTIYEMSGQYYARCLSYNCEKFVGEMYWLNQGFDNKHPILIRAVEPA